MPLKISEFDSSGALKVQYVASRDTSVKNEDGHIGERIDAIVSFGTLNTLARQG